MDKRDSCRDSSALRNCLRRETVGFSLVELLVGMVTIALLATLLIVGLNRVARRAEASTCASNLRQLGSICLLYAGDHGGVLPVAGNPSTGANRWQSVLKEKGYLSDMRITVCPSLQRDDHPVTADEVPWGNQGYGIRYWTNLYGAKWSTKPPVLALIEDPARWPYIGDSVNVSGYGRPQQVCWLTCNNGSPTDNVVDLRHGGKANILFADGHVEQLGPDELDAFGPVDGQSFRFYVNRDL